MADDILLEQTRAVARALNYYTPAIYRSHFGVLVVRLLGWTLQIQDEDEYILNWPVDVYYDPWSNDDAVRSRLGDVVWERNPAVVLVLNDEGIGAEE